MSHSFRRWKMVTQGAYAEWNFSWWRMGWNWFIPIISKFLPLQNGKKKLLEIPCKFYNYLWADKQHVILRSENKMFVAHQVQGEKSPLAFSRVCLCCSTLTPLLNKTPTAGSCGSHSSYFISWSAAWCLVQPGHWSSLQQRLKIKHWWLRVLSALNAENKICTHIQAGRVSHFSVLPSPRPIHSLHQLSPSS